MNDGRLRLRLFLDEGVPDSVGRAFAAAGHEVIYGNRVLVRGTPDLVVCVTAMKNGAILVAHDGDMRQIARRYGVTKSGYPELSLIKLSCTEPEAATRVSAAMSLIEHEWQRADDTGSRRLFIEILSSAIRTNR